MKKLMLIIFVFAVALFTGSVAMAQSQDIAGQWQGTLHAPGHDLRTVLKISKAPDGKLGAVMYSIDQGGQPITASSVSVDGSTVKYAVSAINGSFEGTLSADGNTIIGKWTQGPGALDLTLVRTTPDTAWAIPAPPKPMTATDPSFEVATIKLTPPGQPGKLFTVTPGGRQVLTKGTTMNDLIGFAYSMQPKQLINAPDWFDKDKFDITGQPDAEGIPNPDQMKTMMGKLLVDRFQLTFHKDTRVLSIYEIVVGKDGQKLTPTAVQGNLPGLFFRNINPADLMVRNATMVEFAGLMQSAVLDKPVVDHTGLTGKYDFELKWTPDQGQFETFGGIKAPATENADAPPDLFTAIQQQIGLKINSTKGPTDVMVIDKVEKPSAN
ncbi:MAG TPA: TIGR03435 family protein [Candidatus Acidoferrales bacterium]|nr:TIGR03435 family protein [Candidatus Acidoferrales bacterium]